MTAPVMRALEWALALQNAPEQRRELRAMPLPEGVEQVLELAAGTDPERLAEVAAAAGLPTSRVQEAARFYAREVLFHAGADAYRTLGVAPDADQAQLKRHHRLLQRWLHPDREQGDDAIFAARINRAWDALRTPDRRRGYDTAQPSTVPQAEGVAFRPIPVSGVPVSAPRWRRRLPVVLILLACAVLAVVAVRDALRPAAEERADQIVEPETAALSGLGTAVDARMARSANARAAIPPRAASAEPRARQPVPREGATPAAQPVFLPAAPEIATAPPATTVRGQDKAIARRAGGVDGEARVSAPTTASVTTAVPRPATISPSPSRPSPAPVLPQQPPSQAAAPPRIATAETSGATVAVATAEADPAQVLAARKAGQVLLRYLSRSWWRARPAWNNPAVEQAAEDLRQSLNAGGSLALEPPQWRIGASRASLATRVRRSPATDGADGWITAELVYRDGLWLVSDVATRGNPQ